MNKSQFNAMTNMQEAQHANAWRFIIDSWATSEWRPLPQSIINTLGLHPTIGICSSMLVTRTGAQGLNEFINRMNSKRSV